MNRAGLLQAKVLPCCEICFEAPESDGDNFCAVQRGCPPAGPRPPGCTDASSKKKGRKKKKSEFNLFVAHNAQEGAGMGGVGGGGSSYASDRCV